MDSEEFVCHKCDKPFKSKQNLNYHLTNVDCQHIKRTCPNCKKVFSTSHTYKQHIEKQVCFKRKTKPDISETEKGIVTLTDDKQIELKLKELETAIKLADIQKEIELAKINRDIELAKLNFTSSKEPHVVNKYNKCKQYNVHINNFGSESLEMLNELEVMSILDKRAKGICADLVNRIHFNKDFPQNHSLYHTNKRAKDMYVKKSDGWQKCPVKEVVKQVIKNNLLKIKSFVPKEYNTIYMETQAEIEQRSKEGEDICADTIVLASKYIGQSVKLDMNDSLQSKIGVPSNLSDIDVSDDEGRASFGNENITMITREVLREMCQDVHRWLTKLGIQLVYFNVIYKCNQIIRVGDTSTGYCSYYDGTEWRGYTNIAVAKELINNLVDCVKRAFRNFPIDDKEMKKLWPVFNNFVDEHVDDSKNFDLLVNCVAANLKSIDK